MWAMSNGLVMNSAAPARVERAAANGRHDEEPGRGFPRLYLLEDLDPLHGGHADVDEGRGIGVPGQQGKRLFPVLRQVRSEPHPRDRLLQDPADALVVVGYEDLVHGRFFFPVETGRDIVTVVPLPRTDFISSFPPYREIDCLAITRPSPVPFAFVV